MKLNIYIPVLITAALSVFSGCYTVVEHPDVQAKDENGYTYNSKVYFYDDCASCHSDQQPQRQMTQSGEHLSMFKAHEDTAYDNGYYSEEENYSEQYYYPTQYYGDYGHYYNTPWWYTVTPPGEVTKTRNNNDRQATQYNGRSRNESGDRGRDTRQSTDTPRLTSPTVSTSSSGGSGSSSSNSSVQTNTEQNKTETRSSSDNNSSRNSNDQPRSRNNDSNRSSNSGRR
ncbi:MAG: hypothetical protein HF300_02670 [Ignavibacteria bacterium]|jgi:hypothetical protein|nr:hypothetical protein [Ignavibacteria bacterium]MCU7511430.1 hypothetical protein [Ignavibacteria bacterium]MCU7523355.1 hypothetical protein [Ignavibacteria bacterium]